MVDQIHFPPGGMRPVEPPQNGSAVSTGRSVEGPSFREVLQEKLGGVRFSAHAQKRLEARNIQLSESDLARIGEGMNRADSKGGRDSLILMDGLAFVVSVPNRTVVTAMNTPDSRQAVFTQIDSAVFV